MTAQVVWTLCYIAVDELRRLCDRRTCVDWQVIRSSISPIASSRTWRWQRPSRKSV